MTETVLEDTRELPGRIVICVGIDGVGKTPLLDGLRRLDSRVFLYQTLRDPHATTHSQKMQIAVEHAQGWKRELEQERIVLYDRFPYPDDFVYGPITYPDQVKRDIQAETQTWELVILNHRVRYIYIDPLWGQGEVLDTMYRRWVRHVAKESTQQENHFPVHLPRIHKGILTRYEQFLRSTGAPVLRLPALPEFGLEQFQFVLRWILAHENELDEERWNAIELTNNWAVRACRAIAADEAASKRNDNDPEDDNGSSGDVPSPGSTGGC